MVEDIYKLKNKILLHVERETQNMDRIDVKEVGELVDMVKDLAEAEKSCWEASYYKAVTQAMEGGQDAAGYGAMRGYGQQSMRQGYGQGQQGGRQGYHGDELIDKLGEEFRSLSPDEQIMMKGKVLSVIGSM